MQTPKLRPKNLKKKKKKGGAPANSPTPKPRPRNLATKKEKDALDSGFRIQEMEGREREVMKMAYGGKVKKMAYGGKCRGMGKATQGGNYSKMG
jgi:hypothetical protein